ncbi:MAG TPA: hypothetical protein VK837_12900 [Longimicrobiales bacterium]|nr:hypothetical protein [Longimicrobiales bacterium]
MARNADERRPPAPLTGERLAWVAAGAVTVFALLVRLVGLDHTPHIDEVYHVLAGRSLLDDGTLRLSPDGMFYTRARIFTTLVAGSMAAFGRTLEAARIPAVLAGALLAGAVYFGVRRHGNRLAAWIAAALVALGPIDLYLSQLVRFYTLHALLIWLVLLGVYALASRKMGVRSALGVAAACVAGLAVSYTLQPSTLLAVLGMGAAAAPLAAWLHRDRLRALPVAAWVVAAGLLAIGAGWLLLGDVGPRLLGAYRAPSPTTLGRSAGPRFYFDTFAGLFGALWAALPALAVIAATRRPRFVGFLSVFAAVVLVGASLSTWRHERYVYFALPAVYAVAALGISTLLAWVRDAWTRLFAAAGTAPERAPRLALVVTVVAAAGAAAFAAFTIDAVSYTYRMLTVDDADWWLGGHFRGEADWARAARSLEALGLPDGAVVASSPQKATYFLGDVDFILLGRALSGTDGAPREPDIDEQWNRPEVASADAISAIMACREAGVILVERREWRRAAGVPETTADRIERDARRLPIPEDTRLLAYAWAPDARPAAPPPGWSCAPQGGITRSD